MDFAYFVKRRGGLCEWKSKPKMPDKSRKTVRNKTNGQRLKNLMGDFRTCLRDVPLPEPAVKRKALRTFPLHPATAYKVQTFQRHGTYLQKTNHVAPTITMRNILHLPRPKQRHGKLMFHSKCGWTSELTQEKKKRYACQRRAKCAKHTKVHFHFPMFTACK